VLKHLAVGVYHKWCIGNARVGCYIDRKNIHGVNKLKQKKKMFNLRPFEVNYREASHSVHFDVTIILYLYIFQLNAHVQLNMIIVY